jgi:hypothetical protein
MPLLATVPAGIPPKLSDSLLNAALLFNGTISRGSQRITETKTPLARLLEPRVPYFRPVCGDDGFTPSVSVG